MLRAALSQERARWSHLIWVGILLTLTLSLFAVIGSTRAADASIPVGYGTGSGFCASVVSSGNNLGANFDNIYACGPIPGGSFPGYGDSFQPAGGFQCTELANRFFYDVWGRGPIFGSSLDGANYVDTAHNSNPSVPDVANGTAGQPYLPGDIVSFTDGSFGHVAVVSASTYAAGDGGNYDVTIMEENAASSGQNTATVSQWSMGKPGGSNETPNDFLALASDGSGGTSNVQHVYSGTSGGVYETYWGPNIPRTTSKVATISGVKSVSSLLSS